MSSEKIMLIGFACFLFLMTIGMGTGSVYFTKRSIVGYAGPFYKRNSVGVLLAIWASAIPSLASAGCMVAFGPYALHGLLWFGVILGMMIWAIVVAWSMIYSRGDLDTLLTPVFWHHQGVNAYFEWRRRIEEKQLNFRMQLAQKLRRRNHGSET